MQILKEEIKNKIINAGKRRFKNAGYENTSMKDIAKDAGISTGNIYRYFLTKKHILNEILNEVEAEIKNFLDSVPSDYSKLEHRKLFDMLADVTVKVAKEKGDALEVLFSCGEENQFIVFKENIVNMIATKLADVSKSINSQNFNQTLCNAVAKSLFEGFSYIVKENCKDIELLRKNLNIYTNIMVVGLDQRVLEISQSCSQTK